MHTVLVSWLQARVTSTRRLVALGLGLVTASAIAGTPLICHPYVIGSARSLPGSDGDWKGVNPAYDRSHLVRDTIALLTPETPIIVRMETLRRAAIYATAGMRGWSTQSGFSAEDRSHTAALLERLRARVKASTGPARALALFDEGFFSETLRHTGVEKSLNGYDLLVQALAVRGSDPEMEFALALATSWPNRRPEHTDHLAKARAAAAQNPRLSSNLASHFSGTR